MGNKPHSLISPVIESSTGLFMCGFHSTTTFGRGSGANVEPVSPLASMPCTAGKSDPWVSFLIPFRINTRNQNVAFWNHNGWFSQHTTVVLILWLDQFDLPAAEVSATRLILCVFIFYSLIYLLRFVFLFLTLPSCIWYPSTDGLTACLKEQRASWFHTSLQRTLCHISQVVLFQTLSVIVQAVGVFRRSSEHIRTEVDERGRCDVSVLAGGGGTSVSIHLRMTAACLCSKAFVIFEWTKKF